MLEIAAAREGFCHKSISDIGFVRRSRSIADGLTKSVSEAALQNVLKTGRLSAAPEQWIIRQYFGYLYSQNILGFQLPLFSVFFLASTI